MVRIFVKMLSAVAELHGVGCVTPQRHCSYHTE
jgi:hypothetical protein